MQEENQEFCSVHWLPLLLQLPGVVESSGYTSWSLGKCEQRREDNEHLCQHKLTKTQMRRHELEVDQ